MYTKGPWEYKQTKVLTSKDEPTYTVYSSSAGKAVARRLINEDDARIIAVAPELLEACKLALSIIEKYSDVHVHILALKQAIAKATGEEK